MARIPQELVLMNVGTELKQARDQAGLSAEQISNRTKIQLYKIEALENNEFDRLPQGIYLDGIVRAYAHEVGIDPEPMVERVRLQRGTLPGDWEVPFAAPIDLHGPSKTYDLQFLETPDGDDPLDEFLTENDDDLPLWMDAEGSRGAEGARGAVGATGAPTAPAAPMAPSAPVVTVAPSAPNTP